MDSKREQAKKRSHESVERLFRVEQGRVLRNILPLIQAGHGIGLLFSSMALISNSSVWQFWAMLVIFVAMSGVNLLAYYQYQHRHWNRSGTFMISSMLIITMSLPVLFRHMILTSAMMSFMSLLTAGFLFSPGKAFRLMALQLSLLIIFAGWVILNPVNNSISFQPLFLSPVVRDLVNGSVFVFSLAYCTRLIYLNSQSMQRSLKKAAAGVQGLKDIRGRLNGEIQDRHAMENYLWVSRQAFQSLADAVIESDDVRELSRKLLSDLAMILNVDWGAVYLNTDGDQSLELVASYAENNESLSQLFWDKLGDVARRVMHRGEVTFLSDLGKNQELIDMEEPLWKEESLRGGIALPLVRSTTSDLGAILLFFQYPREIKTGLRWFFESYVDLAASAFENKRTKQKVDKQAAQISRKNRFLEALYKVLIHIQGIYSPGKILSRLRDEFREMGLDFLFAVCEDDDRYFIEYLSTGGELLDWQFPAYQSSLGEMRFPVAGLPKNFLTEDAPVVGRGPGGLMQSLGKSLPEGDVQNVIQHLGVQEGMTLIYLPLRFQGELIGFIVVWGEDLQAWDASALSVFSGQVVAALENARLYSDERKRSKELLHTFKRLKILRDIDLETLVSGSYRSAAKIVLDHLKEAYPSGESAILVFSPQMEKFRDVITLGDENLWQEIYPAVSDVVEDLSSIQEPQYKFVEDLAATDKKTSVQQTIFRRGFQSYISIPLGAEESVIGTMTIAWHNKNSCRKEVIETLIELGHSLSIAIHQQQLQEERKVHTRQIQKSLHEKEILLSEIHHRVKNNMQIILSLFRLHIREVEDENLKVILDEVRNQIYSLTLVHDMLYQSEDLSDVDLPSYFEQLTNHILRSYQGSGTRYDIDLDIEDLDLHLNQIVPCGLIVHELVSNAIKYAFPDREQGTIFISMAKTGEEVCLAVRDDGVSMPESVSLNNPGTLGLKLVKMLAQQLDGRVKVRRERGTRFEVYF